MSSNKFKDNFDKQIQLLINLILLKNILINFLKRCELLTRVLYLITEKQYKIINNYCKLRLLI